MKPVAIFRHIPFEGAGYFSDFLDRHQIPSVLIKVDENESIPADPTAFSGLVFMGGSMSVNDSLPWIPQSLQLIRDAMAADIPVLGHCLGGQLISKALGATVGPNPIKESAGAKFTHPTTTVRAPGWTALPNLTAFTGMAKPSACPRAQRDILKSDYCANQAYVIGKNLAAMPHRNDGRHGQQLV
jgi:GMP synthase - Glutamine amidotransferase domain